ncbi:hypothetical protein FJZ31_04285 [Candidatus Poribacteria bacterium]|nr:hypothetical protein [Candidatus Poribacteria bacterium]
MVKSRLAVLPNYHLPKCKLFSEIRIRPALSFKQGGKNGKEEEAHYKHNTEAYKTETDAKK